MPLTTAPVYGVSIGLEDLDGNKSSISFNVPVSVVTATALGAQLADSLIPAIEGVSDAIVTSWSISHTAVDLDPASTPPETSDVERKGVFSFRAANGATSTVQVPSIRNSLVIDETNIIDKADAAVVAFVAAVIDPGLLELGKPSTRLGADLTIFDKARKMHRGSSRG